MVASLVIGIIFVVAGVGLRYWINRRKFYRRSPMGAEGFSSYESSVFIKLIEKVGKWVAYQERFLKSVDSRSPIRIYRVMIIRQLST